MQLSNIKPAEGSIKRPAKRLGRGQGSGKGGTATKGHKGAKSRSGNSKKIGFEGGQMPLQRRVPKFGFKNVNRVSYKGVNLDSLQLLVEKHQLKGELTLDVLSQYGLVRKNDKVKVLGRGSLDIELKVHAHKFTQSAKEAIENKGGSAIIV